jgi:hypothetical protein
MSLDAEQLALVETDELVLELLLRFDSAAFVGVKDLTDCDRKGAEEATYVQWHGRRLTCCGLVDYARAVMMEGFMDGRQDVNDHDTDVEFEDES